jgi:hypothetical protein
VPFSSPQGPNLTHLRFHRIGATALTLGIDCFARTGLKEFYIYNLGYHSLFPALNGYPYPLLVNMQILLGVLAACFLVCSTVASVTFWTRSSPSCLTTDCGRDPIPRSRRPPE